MRTTTIASGRRTRRSKPRRPRARRNLVWWVVLVACLVGSLLVGGSWRRVPFSPQGEAAVARKPPPSPGSLPEGPPAEDDLRLPLRVPSPSWKDHRRLTAPGSTRALVEATGGDPHFFTTLSGCRMARWLLPIRGPRPHRRDCYHEVSIAQQQQQQDDVIPPRILTNETIRWLKPNDTIYATFEQVEDLATDLLPLLRDADVVLITGQRENVRPPAPWAVRAILEHPRIRVWCCQNLPKYAAAAASGSHLPTNKLYPFPYGIKQTVRDDPLEPTNQDYKRVFREALPPPGQGEDPPRATALFAGYVNPASNPRARAGLPSGEGFLPPLDYYRRMANATYVLSPDGDRPECYRHYEALGLGTVPLTDLDPLWFCHLRDTGVVFARSGGDGPGWAGDPAALPPGPSVVRNAVLEEYWMEHTDWIAQRNLTWWNRYHPPHGPTTVAETLRQFPWP